MAESITVLVKRASIFWLPPMRGEPDKEGVRPAICGKLKLLPGANDLPLKRWKQSLNHPAVQTYIELGVLVPNPSAQEKTANTHLPDKLSGLKSLSIPKAAVWIEASSDRRQLEAWRNSDNRKGIKAAIDARLAELDEDDGEDAKPAGESLADEDFE